MHSPIKAQHTHTHTHPYTYTYTRMKRSLRTLEQLQQRLDGTGDGGDGGASAAAQRRVAEAAMARRLTKLSPYKQAEYRCIECVAELRQALRDVEELQGATSSSSARASASPPGRSAASREEAEAAEEDGEHDEHAALLGRRGERRRVEGASRDAAVLERELARSRQEARRAHQRLQQLQRDAARLAASAAASASAPSPAAPGAGMHGGHASDDLGAAVPAGSDATAASSTAALATLEWQRASQHVERAKRWYREVFGIRVVSSLDDPVLRLNRPAQPSQDAGSVAHFGSGANPVPVAVTAAVQDAVTAAEGGTDAWDGAGGAAVPPPMLVLRSAREDAEFAAFFATVQANDELIDAAVDRLTEGVGRLLDNARGMQDELAVQQELLQQTESRVDANAAQLVHMNRRLRRAIRDMEDSSLCVYVVCLLVLLLLLGVLLRIVS